MQRQTREIGSEFWLKRGEYNPESSRDGVYALSGRTALDIIIRDIRKTRPVTNAYLPAYSCESMVMPFTDNGLTVSLYDMRLSANGLEYLVDSARATDILYINNYFGYENLFPEQLIEDFRSRGTIVIYDRTHSLLRNEDDPEWADYSFASIRKWTNVLAGAQAFKKNGTLDRPSEDYGFLTSRAEAMYNKAEYIYGDESIPKSLFLDQYSEFIHKLTEDYRGYKMDDISYSIWKSSDLAAIRGTRRSNAAFLHSNLEGVRFLSELKADDCPLFVPVFFPTKEKRDAVRSYLVSKDIYCPVHWPSNSFVEDGMEVQTIFDTELSVICDQRYGLEDMQTVVGEMNNINI